MKTLKIILSPIMLIVIIPIGWLLFTPVICRDWFDIILKDETN